MAQTETPSLPVGSIANVAARLALWARRAPKGLARVEFISDFSRRDAVTALHAALPQSLPVHEIELPFQKPPLEVVHFLRERLRELPPGIVSVTGFAAAFSADCPLEDALRVLNFHREELAQFPLRQIWWMTSPFTDAFLRFIPDLDSWFLVRLTLSEVIVDGSVEQLPTVSINSPYTAGEAHKQSAFYVARFEKAIKNNAPADDLIGLAFMGMFTLSFAKLDQDQNEGENLAKQLLSKLIPTLQSQELIEKDTEVLKPNRSLVSTPNNLLLSQNFSMLAQLCEGANRIEEAEAFYKVALEIGLNPNNDLVGFSFASQSLISFYTTLFRFSEAIAIGEQWVEIEGKKWGRNTRFILLPLNVLLATYLYAGKYKEAEQIFYRTLSVERTLEPNPSSKTLIKSNMAWAYKRLGRYAEADLLTQQIATEADGK